MNSRWYIQDSYVTTPMHIFFSFIFFFFLLDIVQARIVHTKMEPKIESNVIDLKTFQRYIRIKHKISIKKKLHVVKNIAKGFHTRHKGVNMVK